MGQFKSTILCFIIVLRGVKQFLFPMIGTYWITSICYYLIKSDVFKKMLFPLLFIILYRIFPNTCILSVFTCIVNLKVRTSKTQIDLIYGETNTPRSTTTPNTVEYFLL